MRTLSTLKDMSEKPQKSEFVRMIMADASEAEIEEATQNWFAYLQLLDTLANGPDGDDSRTCKPYVKFDDEAAPNV